MIGERIKAILESKGMSQRELARRIGKHPSEVNEIVLGKRDPGASLVEKIAEGLEVSPGMLFGGQPPICEQLVAEIGEEGVRELLGWVRKIKREP